MKTFSELVQQKRVKMLVLCLFMFALIFTKDSVGGNKLTYVLRREGENLKPICVGEGADRYEGIAWTYPLTEEGIVPQEEHHYMPTIKNDYNCKFSYGEHCSKVWSMKNWEIDSNTTRRFDFISDERWEDFPIYHISNTTKDSENRIEIPSIFKLGFSVRASEQIELFVCEGWNPKEYPCYVFNITTKEIQTSKHLHKSENDIENNHIMESYKAYSNIISEDEWRNFEIGIDENKQLELRDMNLNRTLIVKKDEYALRPAYFFFKSRRPSLWKIHQNEFFYTRTPQISRLGPTLKLNSNDLCVNFYISSCENCSTIFFMIRNGTKTLIDQHELRKSGDWTLIRLSKEQVSSDYVNIFLQTLYKDNVEHKNGFWAIDDIRVCHKDEVKISSIKSLKGLNENDSRVSCHILEKPNLRPTKKVLDSVQEFPTIESDSDSTSINLTWSQNNRNDLDYFISYQANDICIDHSKHTKRTKSNGFIITKSDVLFLKDLIPYTTYNVRFSSVLHLKEKIVTVNTKDSTYISLEELPKSVSVDNVTETSAQVTWNEVDCKDIRGHIIYTLMLTDVKKHNSTNHGTQTENTIILTGLHPFTNYTLGIITSRGVIKSEEENSRFVTKITFETKPGLASPPRNLEVYSTSSSTISLRYNLPDASEGLPVEVHVTRCNPLTLKKCKTLILPIVPCKLFLGKYCLHINNMIPQQKQVLYISLKNKGTHTFGKPSSVEAFTEERTPGQPTNVTYRIVDCSAKSEFCNLNISWLHPYDQNGTITGFNILLNSTENEYIDGDNDFKIAMRISEENYAAKYTYQIMKIPFSKKYNLYIQSMNGRLRSPFTTQTVIQTTDLGDEIDQTAKMIKTSEDSLEFELMPADGRISTTLTVIVQDFDDTKAVDEEIAGQEELADNLCNEYGDTWISQIVKVSPATKKITVGKSDPSGKSLKPANEYCITFLFKNVHNNSTQMNVYYEKLTTPLNVEPKPTSASGLNLFVIILIAIVVIILVGFLIFWFIRKSRTSRKPRSNNLNQEEHAYESLPFEETIVNNNMYDHLEHR